MARWNPLEPACYWRLLAHKSWAFQQTSRVIASNIARLEDDLALGHRAHPALPRLSSHYTSFPTRGQD